MTVQTTTNKMAPQAMNGAATNFPFTFRALVDFPSAIKAVIEDTTTGTTTDLIYNDGGALGYTVSIDSDGIGGSITVNDPQTSDYEITIYREYEQTQLSNYADYNAFPADTAENDFDKAIMITQQLQEEVSRAITLAITAGSGISTELPDPLANALIGWNATADALVNNPAAAYQVQVDAAASPDYLGAASSDGALRTDASIDYSDGGDFVTLGVNISNVFGSATFLDISDTPASYAGQALRGIRVNAGETGLEFTTLTTGAQFTSLTDTPANYVGSSLQAVRVNVGETGLEFYTPSAGTTVFTGLTDTPGSYAGSANYLVRVNGTPDALVFSAETTINHNTLTNYDANQHIDHTGVSILAGQGLSGGGTIATNRTLNVDIDAQTSVTLAADDEVMIADTSDSGNIKKVTAQDIADLATGGATTIPAPLFSEDFFQAGNDTAGTWRYVNADHAWVVRGSAVGTVQGPNGIWRIVSNGGADEGSMFLGDGSTAGLGAIATVIPTGGGTPVTDFVFKCRFRVVGVANVTSFWGCMNNSGNWPTTGVLTNAVSIDVSHSTGSPGQLFRCRNHDAGSSTPVVTTVNSGITAGTWHTIIIEYTQTNVKYLLDGNEYNINTNIPSVDLCPGFFTDAANVGLGSDIDYISFDYLRQA